MPVSLLTIPTPKFGVVGHANRKGKQMSDFQFSPENFDSSKYSLPSLDANVITSAYNEFVTLMESLKDSEKSETKTDGSKRVSKLETFANSTETNETTAIIIKSVRHDFFTMAKNDPEQFAVLLHEVRSFMADEAKTLADVVLPEVLSSVTQETSEDSEEVAQVRHEAYGLRESLKKQFDAAKTLEIELPGIPTEKRNTRGGETEVFVLPQVPGTRNASDDETKLGAPLKSAHLIYTINGVELPAGTSSRKAMFVASSVGDIYSDSDLKTILENTQQSMSKDFSVTMPNGSEVIGKVQK